MITPCQLLFIRVVLNDAPQLRLGALLQRRFNDLLKTFRQHLRAPLQFGTQTAFLRTHLISRDMKNVTRLIPTTRNKINRRLSLTRQVLQGTYRGYYGGRP